MNLSLLESDWEDGNSLESISVLLSGGGESSAADEKEGGGGFFSYAGVNNFVIVGLASVGVVVNIGSLIILCRKRACSVFHNLLKVGIRKPSANIASRKCVTEQQSGILRGSSSSFPWPFCRNAMKKT